MKTKLLICAVLILNLYAMQAFSNERAKTAKLKAGKIKLDDITNEDVLENISVKLGPASYKWDRWAFAAGVEILIWQPFGEESDIATASFALTQIRGLTRNFDFDWQVGARLLLGLITPYDDWTLSAIYTHFSPESNNNLIQSAFAGLAGTGDAFLSVYNNATFSFDKDFNYMQFEMGKAFFVSGRFALHPQFGFEVAWINLNNRYTFSNPTSGSSSLVYKDKINFWGAGPRAGAKAKMYLGTSFCFYGRAAAALEFGDFDISNTQTLTGTTDENFTMQTKDFHELVNHNELEVGAEFSMNFNAEKVRLMFKIGYEMQNWSSLNQFFFTNEFDVIDWSKMDGNVNFQGVTFGAGVIF